MAVFSSLGTKLAPDLTGDWETDTLRTGCLGSVTVNLPRVVQESEGDKGRFFELLRGRFELAARALGVKFNVLRQFGRNSLPFLFRSVSGDAYFRLENCSRVVNFVGVSEAVELFTLKGLSDPASLVFLGELVECISVFRNKLSRKYGKRLYSAVLCGVEASERLAQLDIERYGVARVKFSGTRDRPFYSSYGCLRLSDELVVLPEDLLFVNKLSGLVVGGLLGVVELGGVEVSGLDLLGLTCGFVVSCPFVELFTFNRVITFCRNCKKSWFGVGHKCPNCGSMSTLGVFDRFNSV